MGDGRRVNTGTFRSYGSPSTQTFTTAADLATYPRIGITLDSGLDRTQAMRPS